MTEAEEELNKAKNIPAVFVNRMVLNKTDDLIRVCFGDCLIGTDVTFRNAIIMKIDNAVVLADLIMKIANEKAVSH